MVKVSFIRDRSGRPKGLGYVEFGSIDTVPQALLLDGALFCTRHRACMCSGLPLGIKPSEAERNYAALAEAAGGSVLSSNADRRVYLCGLSAGVGEEDLRALGAHIGVVESAKVFKGSKGRGSSSSSSSSSTNFGYIVLKDAAMAQLAAVQLHGLPLDPAGGVISAGKLNAMGHVETPTGEVVQLQEGEEGLTQQARATLMARLSQGIKDVKSQLSSGLGGTSVVAAAAAAADAAAAAIAGNAAVAAIQSANIAAAAAAAAAAATAAAAAAAAAQPPEPSNCICLSNCFNPAEETEEGWQEDILAGVGEEAGKHGRVVFSALDAVHPAGLVFFMLQTPGEAAAAMTAMAGRRFGGKAIAATPVPAAEFHRLYPASKGM